MEEENYCQIKLYLLVSIWMRTTRLIFSSLEFNKNSIRVQTSNTIFSFATNLANQSFIPIVRQITNWSLSISISHLNWKNSISWIKFSFQWGIWNFRLRFSLKQSFQHKNFLRLVFKSGRFLWIPLDVYVLLVSVGKCISLPAIIK